MRFVLPILLSSCLSLTPGMRSALGLPCGCGCPSATADKVEKLTKSRKCSCCCDTSEKKESSSTPATPKRCPATPVCGEWCCGGGFIPLTIFAAAPIPEPAIESAPVAAGPSLCDGCPLRIEHPPRLTA